jgi:hypothetical protein
MAGRVKVFARRQYTSWLISAQDERARRREEAALWIRSYPQKWMEKRLLVDTR